MGPKRELRIAPSATTWQAGQHGCRVQPDKLPASSSRFSHVEGALYASRCADEEEFLHGLFLPPLSATSPLASLAGLVVHLSDVRFVQGGAGF